MICEKEFYRKGYRWGEIIWSILLDTEEGTIRVRSHKTMKNAPEIITMTPAVFAASGGGNGYEHRVFQSEMRKLVGAFVSTKRTELPRLSGLISKDAQ